MQCYCLKHQCNTFSEKGFGSIGVPTYYFTPALANSADNMYVYLYVIFGVFSVLFSFFFINEVFASDYHYQNLQNNS